MTAEDIGNAFSIIVADRTRNVPLIGQRKADKKFIKHIELLSANINGSAPAPEVTEAEGTEGAE